MDGGEGNTNPVGTGAEGPDGELSRNKHAQFLNSQSVEGINNSLPTSNPICSILL